MINVDYVEGRPPLFEFNGVFKEVCDEKIKQLDEKYSNEVDNHRFDFKIHTVFNEGINSNVKYDVYDYILICSEDENLLKGYEKYNKYSNNSIWFDNANTLLKFVEFLYMFTKFYEGSDTDLVDANAWFSYNKTHKAVKYAFNEDFYDVAREMFICCFAPKFNSEVVNKALSIYDKCKNEMDERRFLIFETEYNLDNMIFYIE